MTGWTQHELKYFFDLPAPGIPESQQRSLLAQAYGGFAAVIDRVFTPTTDLESAQLRFELANGSALGNQYAVSALPNDNEFVTTAFNTDYIWSPDLFLSVAAHEIGHQLGLTHSDYTEAVMYPHPHGVSTPQWVDDIPRLLRIYPAAPGFDPTPPAVIKMRDCKIISYTLSPSVILSGQPVVFTVTLKNTGQTTWVPEDVTNWTVQSAVGRRGYALGAGANSVLWGLQRIGLPTPVLPDATITISGTLHAPLVQSPGIYPLIWQMVDEWEDWFGEILNVQLTVNVGSPPPVSSGPPVDALRVAVSGQTWEWTPSIGWDRLS